MPTPSGTRSEEQAAVLRDLASITARQDRLRRERCPLVVGHPGFVVGTILAFIAIFPLALTAMNNLNLVTLVVVRPYVSVGPRGVFAVLGAWVCLAVCIGIGVACIAERRWRWSVVLPLVLVAVCILCYAQASNAASAHACAYDKRPRVQMRC